MLAARRAPAVARSIASGALAFVEAARQTLLAPFLVDERRLTTLLAEVADAARVDVRRRRCPGHLHLADMLGGRARGRMGKRQDLAGAEPHRRGAADAGELADDLFEPALRR